MVAANLEFSALQHFEMLGPSSSVPSHRTAVPPKILFCWIPKVGCTRFRQLFRTVREDQILSMPFSLIPDFTVFKDIDIDNATVRDKLIQYFNEENQTNPNVKEDKIRLVMVQYLSQYKVDANNVSNQMISSKIIDYLLKKQETGLTEHGIHSETNAPPPKRIQHPQSYVELEKILVDPSWRKALFYREPLSRFLSAFLFSCRGEKKWRWMCADIFGSSEASFSAAVATLHTYGGKVAPNGDRSHRGTAEMDAHVRPQADFCGGHLHDTLHRYDTVVELDPSSSRTHVQALLGGFLSENDVVQSEFDRLFPPDGKLQNGHDTHSHERVYEFYSAEDPALVGTVIDFYYRDYIIFHIEPPTFAMEILRNLTNEDKFSRDKMSQLEKIVSTNSPLKSLKEIASKKDGRIQYTSMDILNSLQFTVIILFVTIFSSYKMWNKKMKGD